MMVSQSKIVSITAAALLLGAAALAPTIGHGHALNETAPAAMSMAVMPDRDAIKRIVVEQAERTTVPAALALALAKVESDFQANAVNASGARGVLQLPPALAENHFGVAANELWDPTTNVELGLDHLAGLFAEHGRWDLALSHYHFGRVAEIGGVKQVDPAAQGFVDSVLRWRDRYQAQNTLWATLRARAQGGYPQSASATSARPAPSPRPVIVVERHVAAPAPIVTVFEDRAPVVFDRPSSFAARLAATRRTLDDFAGRRPASVLGENAHRGAW